MVSDAVQAARAAAAAAKVPKSDSVQAARIVAAAIAKQDQGSANVRESGTRNTPAKTSTYYTGNPNLITNQKANTSGTIKTGTGISKNNNNQDTTPTNTGDTVIGSMPPAPKPIKRPTAADLGVVKNPSRDVTDIASLVPQADQSTVARLLFEQFSAVELAQLLTPRTIDGIEQQYSIISNLSDIRRRYNSTRQLTVMDKLAPISGVFGIDLNSKIPGDDYIINNNLDTEYSYIDENNNLVTVEKGYIYIDTNGDLVIEFDNMTDDEIIQVQIDTNGTIYEVTN